MHFSFLEKVTINLMTESSWKCLSAHL